MQKCKAIGWWRLQRLISSSQIHRMQFINDLCTISDEDVHTLDFMPVTTVHLSKVIR